MRHASTGLCAALLASAFAASASAQAPCLGDLNADRVVDGIDLGALLVQWGGAGSADLNADGFVDGVDLGVLLAGWGACPVVTPAWATLVEALPDPAVVTDPMLRGRITATGWAWRVRDTATEIEMLLVPPGTFQMGCVMGSALVGCTPFEGPVHPVTLTDAFYLGRYEVTQAQWLGRMGTNPSRYQASNGHPGSMERPVEAVSWEMAQAFVASAGLRLPTEAEWEYACRAGTETPFHAGPGFPLGTSDDALLTLIAHFRSAPCQVCLVTTTQVGGKAANSLGLHDLLGNVWEWTNDRSSNYYEPGPQTNPTGPLFGNARVFRGGSFSQPSGSTRSSFRRGLDAGSWYDDLGFRVARNP